MITKKVDLKPDGQASFLHYQLSLYEISEASEAPPAFKPKAL
jgi:hypothetical protein